MNKQEFSDPAVFRQHVATVFAEAGFRAVDLPVFDAPVFDAPVFDAPVFDAPVFDAPVFASHEKPAMRANPGGLRYLVKRVREVLTATC